MSASSMADKITPFTERFHAPEAERPQRADWPAWPTYGLVDDLLPVMRAWREQGRRIAVATLVHVDGSSPRPVGSEMAINDRGEVAGYVSGGCVEAAVAAQALEVLETGTPVTLDYGAGSPVLDVQLTCGGRIGIFVRALPDADDYVARWNDARIRRRAFDVRIELSDGSHGYGPIGEPAVGDCRG
jgi:xanthine dehydrogenase accessory factor